MRPTAQTTPIVLVNLTLGWIESGHPAKPTKTAIPDHASAARSNSISVKQEDNMPPIILVVEDVHETRDGIETLLTADRYRVAMARDERDAIESAQRTTPDLILISLAGSPREVIFSALGIRQRAAVGEGVPIIVFGIEGIDEGDEVAIGKNVHLTRPDNFNQLRSLIARLLNQNTSPLMVETMTSGSK
jgi:DNA-binding response OmpR family regulator